MTDEKEEVPILVCSRFATAVHLEGEIKGKCDTCDAVVAVSRAGQQLLADNDKVTIWCELCMLKKVKSDDFDCTIEFVPGASEEAMKHWEREKEQERSGKFDSSRWFR